jgi:pyridoxine 5-phosphate synthase
MTASSPSTTPAKTALSVNVNKVALLRNTRHLGVPSVVRAAQLCLEAGANGITVHPRPDQRHIRSSDVFDLADMLRDWPGREFNIEGNPYQNLLPLVAEVVARGLPLHQVTLVPDSEDQFTSDHGWSFPQDADRLRPLIAQLHDFGLRVSLFLDPIPSAIPAAQAVGADRIELYTESYASAALQSQKNESIKAFAQSSRAAAAINLGVNAGHDLSLSNLTEFLKSVPNVLEVSIGHALVADALEMGYAAAVAAYLGCIDEAFGPQNL